MLASVNNAKDRIDIIDGDATTLGKALPPIKPLRLDQAALTTIQPTFFEVHCNRRLDQVKVLSQVLLTVIVVWRIFLTTVEVSVRLVYTSARSTEEEYVLARLSTCPG